MIEGLGKIDLFAYSAYNIADQRVEQIADSLFIQFPPHYNDDHVLLY